MRTMRRVLAGVAALALLAGLGSAVVAQEEPADQMAPAWVTGTVAFGSNDLPGKVTADAPAVIVEGIGYRHMTEASDPRLSGAVTYTGNSQRYPGDAMRVEAGSVVLTTDDGRWVGAGTALVGPDLDADVITLHGEGAYEGWTAHAFLDWSTRPPNFNAAIFPGEMPSPPEPRTAELPRRAASAACGTTPASAPPAAHPGTVPSP